MAGPAINAFARPGAEAVIARQRTNSPRMAVDCERPDEGRRGDRGAAGPVPVLPGARAGLPRPVAPSGLSRLPDECEPGFDDLVVERFPVEIDALRVYFTPDGVFPDLVQAFNPPLVLAEGDVLEPTVPVDLPEGCRSLPGSGSASSAALVRSTCWSPLPTSSSFTPGDGDGVASVISLVGGAVGSVVWTVGSRVGVSDAVVVVTVVGSTVVVRGTGTVVGRGRDRRGGGIHRLSARWSGPRSCCLRGGGRGGIGCRRLRTSSGEPSPSGPASTGRRVSRRCPGSRWSRSARSDRAVSGTARQSRSSSPRGSSWSSGVVA